MTAKESEFPAGLDRNLRRMSLALQSPEGLTAYVNLKALNEEFQFNSDWYLNKKKTNTDSDIRAAGRIFYRLLIHRTKLPHSPRRMRLHLM